MCVVFPDWCGKYSWLVIVCICEAHVHAVDKNSIVYKKLLAVVSAGSKYMFLSQVHLWNLTKNKTLKKKYTETL